jgi:haloalkane dehalogenase
MKITRHYLTVNGRTVHYRRCGSGPSLLMVHQSPRSSKEYEALMLQWGAHFACIAPDTPGFGQSDPLPQADPDINDYADAVVEFTQALGLEKTAAYGFHSGGIILVTALKRHPEFFTGLAVGGYAIWTPEEMAVFSEAYLPPFLPSAYGEHLMWLWNRILEQSWFFPWFDVRDEARLLVAHDDPLKIHAVVMEMLDAGNAYRLGYGAVLHALRDIPAPDAITPPVLITAYDGDPLQAHIDRLGATPAGWSAAKVENPDEHHNASFAFLRAHAGEVCKALSDDSHHGFIHVETPDYNGLIHWRGNRGCDTLIIHAAGCEMQDDMPPSWIGIDMPGHGLSDPWPDTPPESRAAWDAVIEAARTALGAQTAMFRLMPEGDPERLFPSLAPDRHGHYLATAWSIARAECFFRPWYSADAAHAAAFKPDEVEPAALAKRHRALLRANAARAMMIAYQKGDNNGNS